MIYIAHRGNINGPNVDENMPYYIIQAIEKGYDVETDVWRKNNILYLGHDMPQYEIDITFLETYKDKLWCHAKNVEAFEFLLSKNFHTFWHQEDEYTITSKKIIWAYPGNKTSGIYVMPEKHNTPIENCLGICSDYVEAYKKSLNQIPFTFGIITDGTVDENIKRIIESINQVPIKEIIIVGNTNIKNVKTVPFDETKKRAWITKKKNLIAQNSKYDNLVILHDYIVFEDNWYLGFLEYLKNEDFDIISNKILNYDNSRYRDWSLFPLFLQGDYNIKKHEKCNEIINSGCLLPYDYKSNEKINRYIYYSGAYFIVKKEVLLKHPLDEKKSWGEGEDVEWSRVLSDKYIFKFNPHSTVKLLKMKHSPLWQKEIDVSLIPFL